MKIVVAYEHNSADLSTVYLAVVPRAASPSPDSWKPAYRDTTNEGKRVIYARFERDAGVVWLKDQSGERKVTRLT